MPTPAPVAPAVPFATVTGTLYDSVHASPLRRAMVTIVGTSRMAMSDQDGRFRIDSIPTGYRRAALEHPLLDSLGLHMVTDSFPLQDGETKVLDIHTPSTTTLVALSCPAAVRAIGPTAIIGRLLDADTDVPVDSARVSFAWQEISLTAGLRRVGKLRDAKTGADGVFRICGLPGDVEGTLQATKGGIATSEVRISVEGRSLVVQGLRIGNASTVVRDKSDSSTRSARDAAAAGQRFSAPTVQRGQAVLSGRVLMANGQPVSGARVDLEGVPGGVLTKDNGEFTLTGLPAGTQTVWARQLGYAPVDQAVELSSKTPQTVTITLSKPAQALAPIVVKAKMDEGLDRIGFTQRKRGAAGGYFVTGEEVMQRAPNVLTDVFRSIPMLKVTPGGSFGNEYVIEDARSVGLAGACVHYVIDGTSWDALYPGDVDRLIPPWDIGAIEVYHATSVPMQFSQAGKSGCVTIVIWSKQKLEGPPRKTKRP